MTGRKLGALPISAAIAAAGVLAAAPAFANGGDFFEELSATWQSNADEGVPYFGFVRDSSGKLISNATVTATTASGSSFVVQADNMGHYKIPGFSKSVDPKRVQVTCSKPGYRLVSRDRRILRGATNVPVETDCTLAPNPGKPVS